VIGIVDWGIGGIGFLQELRKRRPHADILYFSDTGATPYGRLARAALGARLAAVVAALAARGVTHLAVACNAASTVLPKVGWSMPTTGVIEHGSRFALATGARSFGVVGGVRTIRSGAYRRALAGPGRRIRQRVAQPLSALIEAGDVGSPELRGEVRRIVAPLRDVDALVLGCTHYPAIAPLFGELLKGVKLIDPAAAMADWVDQRWPLADGGSPPAFLTSGDPRAMRLAARRAFGEELGRVERVVL
jgi:glutamate racemase